MSRIDEIRERLEALPSVIVDGSGRTIVQPEMVATMAHDIRYLLARVEAADKLAVDVKEIADRPDCGSDISKWRDLKSAVWVASIRYEHEVNPTEVDDAK